MSQIYIKVSDCPFDMEDFFKDIPRYTFKNIEYVKIDVHGDYKNMSIVDVELTDQKINENAGSFNGWGCVPKKEFLPCQTSLFEVFN